MTATDCHSPFTESSSVPIQPDLLVSAVMHLMSQYTANVGASGDCIKLASIIERHLRALADFPGLPPVLQATCQQLSEQWAGVVDRAMPKPAKASFFKRLVIGRSAN